MATKHTLLAALSFLYCLQSYAAPTECEPVAVEKSAKFPLRSQLRGQEGIVYLNVHIDESGRVASTYVHRSSGYRLLDRSARASVLNDWVFDVSQCHRNDLPVDRVIAVEYRNDVYR